MSEETWMNWCFNLAEKAGKLTLPNPPVGALLVYNDKIIGEGYHEKVGLPHAEVNCIESVLPEFRHLIPESTLYVSLEPCCHYGRTPPCTNMIMANNIKKVIISTTDPTDKVAGKGIAILRANNVKVTTDILVDRGKWLIRRFITNNLKKRPYILLKIAKSRDHYMGKPEQQVWLTSATTGIYTHKLRSNYHGILVGSQTVLTDNPALTTRKYLGDNPVRIVLDRRQRLHRNYKIFDGSAATIIATTSDQQLSGKNVSHVLLDEKAELQLINLMSTLYDKNIYSLIIEGGAQVMTSFLRYNLWDEAVVITTPDPLHQGIPAPNITGEIIKESLIDNDKVTHIKNVNID